MKDYRRSDNEVHTDRCVGQAEKVDEVDDFADPGGSQGDDDGTGVAEECNDDEGD